MAQMLHLTATYENGVLKLLESLPGFANGDRVEIALVRVAPIDRDAPTEVARRERLEQEHRNQATTSQTEVPDEYDVLEAMNTTRLSEGARPLLPPAGER